MAGGQRADRGARDAGVVIAVHDVVIGAACAAHGEGAGGEQREQQQDVQRGDGRLGCRRQRRAPPAGQQQQPGADRPVPACEARVRHEPKRDRPLPGAPDADIGCGKGVAHGHARHFRRRFVRGRQGRSCGRASVRAMIGPHERFFRCCGRRVGHCRPFGSRLRAGGRRAGGGAGARSARGAGRQYPLHRKLLADAGPGHGLGGFRREAGEQCGWAFRPGIPQGRRAPL